MPRTPVDVMRGLLARFFPEPTFRPWILCAAAIFGLTYGLNDEDQRFIAECMGLDASVLPRSAATRVALVVGRRGGKSRFAAFLGVFAACFRDYTDILAPGKGRGDDRRARPSAGARVIFGYVKALITQTPMTRPAFWYLPDPRFTRCLGCFGPELDPRRSSCG